jgi:hypothetical protein
MTRRNAGSIVAGVAALGFFGTAALHSTGYKAITELSMGTAPELQAVAPALWLVFSFDLVVLGLIVGIIAFRPSSSGRLILVVVALGPISAAGLQIRFLGFVPPTAILLGIGALTLVAAGVLPRSGQVST